VNHKNDTLRSPADCLIDGPRLKVRRGDSGRRGWGADGLTEQELNKLLAMLRTEHRDLDAAIEALTGAGSTDQLQIARLKKRKLRLKDQIAVVEDQLLPDIIA
jgi:hypothetical protein